MISVYNMTENMYNTKLTDNKLGLYVDVYKRETHSKL